MATKNLTAKQVAKGAKAINEATATLAQALKSFQGLYNLELAETDGIKCEEWMSFHGVERVRMSNGKLGGYTPASINAGWHDGMKEFGDDGKVKRSLLFASLPAYIEVRDESTGKVQHISVYSGTEIKKENPKPVRVYCLTDIKEHSWSVPVITRGLRQSKAFDKHNDKMIKSLLEYNQIEEFYVPVEKKEKNAKGEVVRVKDFQKVPKSRVMY